MKKASNLSLLLLLIVFLSESSSSVSPSRIRIESDGGYSGIVIKINKRVPEEKCPEILHNLKTLLRDSSTILHSSLNGRVYFKSVTVVIPSSWRDGKCQTVIRGPQGDAPYRGGDLIIDNDEDNAAIEEPFTHQSRGCGQRGDFISVPYHFVTGLTDNNDTLVAAKSFVKNWVKFRYGVFDELGFPGDRLYPNYYVAEGQVYPTGTHNGRMNGLWFKIDAETECDPMVDDDCHFYADLSANDHVRCSLNFAHFLPNVDRFCSKGEEMAFTPTKQNVLCDGRTISEVIDANVDFKRLADPLARSNINTTPQITLVREPLEQFVLLIETSASMDNREQWKWINKAAQKFIRYDLPVNSNLAIVTFSDKAKVEHHMVQVHSNEVRARLADTIPDKYHLSRKDDRCVLCGLQTVIHEVLRDNLGGTHIILVTQGSADTLSSTDEDVIRNYVSDYDVKLSSVILPNGSDYLDFYDSIDGTTAAHVIKTNNDINIMRFYAELNEALAKILRQNSPYPTEMPELVHMREFESGETSRGSFLVDGTLGRDTVFGIYVPDEEEHLIKAISFSDSDGKTYGPYLRMSSSFDLVNFKTINYPSGQAPPFNAPHQVGMTWHYTIEWYPSSSVQNRRNIVVVTSKPQSRQERSLINVETWTSNVTSSSSAVAVYARVTLGDTTPIIAANVVVSATVEQPNGTTIELEPLRLNDDGNGDPDLVSGDGVYSRYLGRYLNIPGRYKFKVEIDDLNDSAHVLVRSSHQRKKLTKKSKLSQTHRMVSSCCGSSISHFEDDGKEKLGVFRRVADGPVLHIKAVFPSKEDVYPPSKINDFLIEEPYMASTDKLIAQWSSSGEDFNVGSASSYRILFSDNFADLLKADGNPGLLLELEHKVEFRETITQEFAFPFYDRDYYVGVVAVDSSGNPGRISNLVRVKVNSPPTTVSAVDLTELLAISGLDSTSVNKGELDWIMIGVIAGVLGVLLVMVVAAIAYYLVTGTRRKRNVNSKSHGSTSSSVNCNSSDHETDSSSFDSDIKNIMSNPLGPSLSLPPVHGGDKAMTSLETPSMTATMTASASTSIIMGSPTTTVVPASAAGNTNSSGTSVTPVYWSASQLLSKLDQSSPPPLPHHQYPYEVFGYQVPHGPQSLQLHPPQLNGAQQGPSSLIQNSSWSYSHQDFNGQRIPDEYTITVGNLRGNSNADEISSPAKRKVPPPVLPKPRNITQV